jgi:hypothetical protein
MSMLTPPGMSGKKYRITGDRYPRMRRPRRRGRKVLALIASLALIGALGYGTVQLVDVFRGDGDRQDQAGDAAGQDCLPDDDAKPEALPEPEVVTVNVYNATDRAGLAQQTAQALADRGGMFVLIPRTSAQIWLRDRLLGVVSRLGPLGKRLSGSVNRAARSLTLRDYPERRRTATN